jgi:hypothetical protein
MIDMKSPAADYIHVSLYCEVQFVTWNAILYLSFMLWFQPTCICLPSTQSFCTVVRHAHYFILAKCFDHIGLLQAIFYSVLRNCWCSIRYWPWLIWNTCLLTWKLLNKICSGKYKDQTFKNIATSIIWTKWSTGVFGLSNRLDCWISNKEF